MSKKTRIITLIAIFGSFTTIYTAFFSVSIFEALLIYGLSSISVILFFFTPLFEKTEKQLKILETDHISITKIKSLKRFSILALLNTSFLIFIVFFQIIT
jgi:hypothetical protein